MRDHDPFNDSDLAHPRAKELMAEDFFWDCVDEEAPFGSDEGFDAYYEYRSWRQANNTSSLVDCLSWIMSGELNQYNLSLCTDEAIQQAIDDPEHAFLGNQYDVFTLDATVIATALGQLIDEGHIDLDAKPFAYVSISRQMHPRLLTSQHRRRILLAIQKVIQIA